MKSAINLLPSSYHRKLLLRRCALVWGAVLGVVLLIGALLQWSDVHARQVVVQRFDLLEREHRPTQRMLTQLVAMRRELADLRQLEQIAGELEEQRPVLTLLGAVSHIAEQAGGRLRITEMALSGLQPIRSNAAAASDARAGNLVLTGVSLDYPAIAELLTGLQDSELFARVELVKSTKLGGEQQTLFDYQVRCEFDQ
jgi:hypothetical protein